MKDSDANRFASRLSRQRMNAIALLLTCLLTGSVYLAAFDTNNPRVLESGMRDADGNSKTQFKVGEVIYVYRHYCVDRLSNGDVDIEIYSPKTGLFWYVGSRASNAKPGCSRRTSATVLPRIPPGVYEYRATATYVVNPFRVLTYALPAVQFEVIE